MPIVKTERCMAAQLKLASVERSHTFEVMSESNASIYSNGSEIIFDDLNDAIRCLHIGRSSTQLNPMNIVN